MTKYGIIVPVMSYNCNGCPVTLRREAGVTPRKATEDEMLEYKDLGNSKPADCRYMPGICAVQTLFYGSVAVEY